MVVSKCPSTQRRSQAGDTSKSMQLLAGCGWAELQLQLYLQWPDAVRPAVDQLSNSPLLTHFEAGSAALSGGATLPTSRCPSMALHSLSEFFFVFFVPLVFFVLILLSPHRVNVAFAPPLSAALLASLHSSDEQTRRRHVHACPRHQSGATTCTAILVTQSSLRPCGSC